MNFTELYKGNRTKTECWVCVVVTALVLSELIHGSWTLILASIILAWASIKRLDYPFGKPLSPLPPEWREFLLDFRELGNREQPDFISNLTSFKNIEERNPLPEWDTIKKYRWIGRLEAASIVFILTFPIRFHYHTWDTGLPWGGFLVDEPTRHINTLRLISAFALAIWAVLRFHGLGLAKGYHEGMESVAKQVYKDWLAGEYSDERRSNFLAAREAEAETKRLAVQNQQLKNSTREKAIRDRERRLTIQVKPETQKLQATLDFEKLYPVSGAYRLFHKSVSSWLRTMSSEYDFEEGYDLIVWETYLWHLQSNKRTSEIGHDFLWIRYYPGTTECLDCGNSQTDMDPETRRLVFSNWDGRRQINLFRDEFPSDVSKWIIKLLAENIVELSAILKDEGMVVNEIKDDSIKRYFSDRILSAD